MNTQLLIDTARAMVADDKGVLAMDESHPTCNKRFAKLGIPQTEEARREYRELLITTPGLGESISGVILFDETIRQQKKDGTPFIKVITDAGIIPGIKVDAGAKDMAGHPGEKITEGLDGLRDRLTEYFQMGARFAKWRAVITVGDGVPSRSGLEANAHALARYAALCQEAGLVPIVEPEVLMDGDHTLERCRKATEEALRNVFIQLNCQRVMLEGIILKPNMVLPGLTCPQQASDEAVADATVQCLLRNVPAAVPGIAFLSGGQSAELASARLNAMNVRFKSRVPWSLSFSFGRALQQPALEIWHGQEANVKAAQQALLHRARCNRAARRGEYEPGRTDPPAIALGNSVAPESLVPATEAGVGERSALKQRALERWENEGGEMPAVPTPQPVGMSAVCRAGKKLFVFDLDGTLAESKAALDAEMAALLKTLLGQVKVAVISGGDWPQFETQLLANLSPDANLKQLSLLPTSGTKFYQFDSGWQQLYADDFTKAEKEKIIQSLEAAVAAEDFGIKKIWGEQIENRGSQITFSALGQRAPLEQKEKWDADFTKRKQIKATLKDLIPEFTVRLGGTTSIDVTKLGIDKAYGIKKLREILGIELEEMLFAGDALFPGGNDYPVKEAGVMSIQVNNAEETKRVIETFLAS